MPTYFNEVTKTVDEISTAVSFYLIPQDFDKNGQYTTFAFKVSALDTTKMPPAADAKNTLYWLLTREEVDAHSPILFPNLGGSNSAQIRTEPLTLEEVIQTFEFNPNNEEERPRYIFVNIEYIPFQSTQDIVTVIQQKSAKNIRSLACLLFESFDKGENGATEIQRLCGEPKVVVALHQALLTSADQLVQGYALLLLSNIVPNTLKPHPPEILKSILYRDSLRFPEDKQTALQTGLTRALMNFSDNSSYQKYFTENYFIEHLIAQLTDGKIKTRKYAIAALNNLTKGEHEDIHKLMNDTTTLIPSVIQLLHALDEKLTTLTVRDLSYSTVQTMEKSGISVLRYLVKTHVNNQKTFFREDGLRRLSHIISRVADDTVLLTDYETFSLLNEVLGLLLDLIPTYAQNVQQSTIPNNLIRLGGILERAQCEDAYNALVDKIKSEHELFKKNKKTLLQAWDASDSNNNALSAPGPKP